MEINIQGKSAEEIFKLLNLKEHSVYEVQVMTSKNNVKHYAYLFTGFKTGSYCEIYNNSYDRVIKMQEVYSIGKAVFLHQQKKTFVLGNEKPKPVNDSEIYEEFIDFIESETGQEKSDIDNWKLVECFDLIETFTENIRKEVKQKCKLC